MSIQSSHDDSVHLLDARELEPPEPMVQVLELLEILAPGHRICLLLRREPHPLYAILERNGYAWKTGMTPEYEFEILIWRVTD